MSGSVRGAARKGRPYRDCKRKLFPGFLATVICFCTNVPLHDGFREKEGALRNQTALRPRCARRGRIASMHEESAFEAKLSRSCGSSDLFTRRRGNRLAGWRNSFPHPRYSAALTEQERLTFSARTPPLDRNANMSILSFQGLSFL